VGGCRALGSRADRAPENFSVLDKVPRSQLFREQGVLARWIGLPGTQEVPRDRRDRMEGSGGREGVRRITGKSKSKSKSNTRIRIRIRIKSRIKIKSMVMTWNARKGRLPTNPD
jgi:hypothetical protein